MVLAFQITFTKLFLLLFVAIPKYVSITAHTNSTMQTFFLQVAGEWLMLRSHCAGWEAGWSLTR
jgi:hypothetical protein